jgi:hypothetical protein
VTVLDWLQGFLELTEGLPSPPVFRLWTGISTLASVLERKAWLSTSMQVLYPNLYVVLVGLPGSGKDQAMTPAHRLLVSSKSVILAPDDMTKAAMIDVLAKSKKRILYDGQTREYHPLCIVVPELGTLVNAHDLEFFSVLNKLFDNKDVHRSQRRGHNSGEEITITHPTVNILAGTQPGFLNSLLPEEAWHMGFTARLFMIHASVAPSIDPFAESEDRADLFAKLAQGLTERGKLVGPFTISEEAKLNLRLWVTAGMRPVPEHTRLAHYRARRILYVLKLSMLAAISRHPKLVIALEDVERARSWLISAETLMPDIFRDMMMKNDSTLMNEVHRFAYKIWVDSAPRDVARRRPLEKRELMSFLALRCPAMVAEKILEVMVLADWMEQDRNNPSLYIPRTRGFRTDE